MNKIIPNDELLVNVKTNTETIKQFLEEYRNLLDKYGFVTEITNEHYLVFNLYDLIKIDIKSMYKE